MLQIVISRIGWIFKIGVGVFKRNPEHLHRMGTGDHHNTLVAHWRVWVIANFYWILIELPFRQGGSDPILIALHVELVRCLPHL